MQCAKKSNFQAIEFVLIVEKEKKILQNTRKRNNTYIFNMYLKFCGRHNTCMPIYKEEIFVIFILGIRKKIKNFFSNFQLFNLIFSYVR